MAVYHVFLLVVIQTAVAYSSMRNVTEGCSPKSPSHSSRIQSMHTGDNDCKIQVWNQSIEYFRNQLQWAEPNLVRFTLKFYNTTEKKEFNVTSTADTFEPIKWVWTYQESKGYYPYLSWNIDYGLLSFGLLEAKTLKMEPFLQLDVEGNCDLTLGTLNTTKIITKALTKMTSMFDLGNKYEESYYCFLAENPTIKNTIEYTAAVYFMYPVSYINYNCCRTCHNYLDDNYEFTCFKNQIEKWTQCLIGPYILCVIIFLYFPIYLFKIGEYLSKEHNIKTIVNTPDANPRGNSPTHSLSQDDGDDRRERHSHTEWLTLDGQSPYPVFDTFSALWCGINKTHPILVSRIKRLLCILLIPVVIYIQIEVYRMNALESTRELLKHGTPIGFLSLLGVQDAFAPVFGGPICLLVAYHIIGMAFIIIPRSLKQIIENGMPRNSKPVSPIFLSARDIRDLSGVSKVISPGYGNGSILCQCGMYLIFSKSFWSKVWTIQANRISSICESRSRLFRVFIRLLIVPVYMVICIAEMLLCLVFYGIPFCMLVHIMVRGACLSLLKWHNMSSIFQTTSFIQKILHKWLIALGSLLVLAAFLYFTYATCLIFIESFYFISQIVVFSFVSVIVYPEIAFGYLFFFLVLIYYIFRLIRDFGDGYLELLYDIIEISKQFPLNRFPIPNRAVNIQYDKCDNIRPSCSEPADDTHDDIHPPCFEPDDAKPEPVSSSIVILRLENDLFQIPKPLFDFIVQRHRPVHQKFLRIVIHVICIVTLIALTMSITTKYVTGPTSEISEVMHVIFIVIVGAIPRALEFAMTSANKVVKREIELRRLKKSVSEFWTNHWRNVYSDSAIDHSLPV